MKSPVGHGLVLSMGSGLRCFGGINSCLSLWKSAEADCLCQLEELPCAERADLSPLNPQCAADAMHYHCGKSRSVFLAL